jgi:hypothetical protein
MRTDSDQRTSNAVASSDRPPVSRSAMAFGGKKQSYPLLNYVLLYEGVWTSEDTSMYSLPQH